jgi:nitroimidazol reductase NimA-like FMN-containing flavoprotein (pyridoxamine 5'-phosphate oxidase superfamily)
MDSATQEHMSEIQVTEKTKLGRRPERGSYDREVINQILDEGFICHIGFVQDGQPFVIPTGYGRRGDDIYFHGSAASRMLRNLSRGIPVCLTVTLVDGLVLARSIFHHSMNYRSVVVLGNATILKEGKEKADALRVISDNIIRGRWNEVREPTEEEMKATSVMKLPINEASAKIRSGPPLDDQPDYDLPIWAGVLPLVTRAAEPIIDPAMRMQVDLPESVRRYESQASSLPTKTRADVL